ncbi:MAG: rhodanese-like domain-containing protein [Neomegalonema sp.]|nr:rhodanese-like domain-containing protein [Neomegalonema sp.]
MTAPNRRHALSLLLASGALLAGGTLSSSKAESLTMDAQSARDAASEGEIVLLDIRTPQEWEMTGIGDVAEPLNLYDPAFLEGLKAIIAANPGKPIALICATGGRTGQAIRALEQSGMSNFIDVSEGMMGSHAGPGWLARKLPVKRPEN